MAMSNLGHLSIPKPEMDRVAFVHDVQTKLFLLYSELVEKSRVGQEVLAQLTADHRVADLNGKLISTGSGASSFDVKSLAMWYLWSANEFGQDQATANLNAFLESDSHIVLNTLWLTGVSVEQTINLGGNVKIVPTAEMPLSRDKELFLRHDFNMHSHGSSKPGAALVQECAVFKSRNPDDTLSDSKDTEFWNADNNLRNIALLLNVIDDVSCVPSYSTSYTQANMPMGPFSGSGGGSSLFDVYGYGNTNLARSKAAEIEDVVHAFNRMGANQQNRVQRILFRLSQAKRRSQIEDKILDLGIALEMALLEDNKDNDQLSLSFRLRGAWLIGETPENRKSIYKILRDIYNYRSQVAHSGSLCKNEPHKINQVRESFQEYEKIAGQIIRKLVVDGVPDWPGLLLDAI